MLSCASGATGGSVQGTDSPGGGSQAEDCGDGGTHHLLGERGSEGAGHAHRAVGQERALL